jgi:hypothetical protein
MTSKLHIPLLGLLWVCATCTHAQDRADIDPTQIIGNRELPKVLYIMPWKKPLETETSGRPLVSVLDEALAPVDRDVFRRQVQYDKLTRPSAMTTAATATAAATAAVAEKPSK